MSSEWDTVQLGDCVELTTGFPFKSTEYIEAPEAIRLLRGDNIGQGILRWDGVKKWPQNKTHGLKGYELRAMDVVLAMDRPWIPAGLKFGRARESDLPALLVQRVARLRPTTRIRADYLYSVIASRAFSEYIQNVTTGTAVPHISAKQIRDFSFKLPDVKTQELVGRFHADLDDRITLLRETNATLESIAQAIFKSWFVDFEPVHAKMEGRAPDGMDEATAALFPDGFEESELGLVPKGWPSRSFRDTINVTGGGTPKTSVTEYWSGEIPWFSVVDAPNSTDVFVIDTQKHITEAGLDGSSTKLLPAGTTIISARGTVGRLALTGRPMAMNQSCYGLRGTAGDDFFTYFSTTRLVRQLKQRAHGSVFDTITQETFSAVSLSYPPREVILAFDGAVFPLMERIKENLTQAQTLAVLRDTLLPRLISGQLRLPAVEALTEELC